MNTWQLGYEGFIMQYMTSGIRFDSFFVRTEAPTQLEMEAELKRYFVPRKREHIDPQFIKIGEISSLNCPWEPYLPVSNSFLELATRADGLKKVSMLGATTVVAPVDIVAKVRIWTYMATRVYLNGEQIAFFDHSAYRPMMHQDVQVFLHQGDNLIFIDSQNISARDQRNIIGIQFLDHRDELRVKLPDEDYQEKAHELSEFMRNARLEGDDLVFDRPAPEGTSFAKEVESEDYYVMRDFKFEWEDISGKTRMTVAPEIAKFDIRVKQGIFSLSRSFEFYERRHPAEDQGDPDFETNKRLVFQKTASIRANNRGARRGFSMPNVLSRHYLGIQDPNERELIYAMLDNIESRCDCAEFEICGYIRYLKLVEIDDDLKARSKEVLTNYRYWQTDPGLDCMCFWSENHALMYYVCQLFVGQLYPDEYFPVSKMTGRELSDIGYRNCLDWLQDVKKTGFEEFLSAVYLNVSLAPLLNLIDYGDETLSTLAEEVTDMMMEGLANHTFRGAMISPMGRVYRGLLYPFSQGSQGLVRLIDYTAPRAFGEGWTSFLVGSKYQFKPGLLEKMRNPYSGSWSTGNALIVLEKQKDYCITSVQSPRLDGYVRWPNVKNYPGIDKTSNEFCRSQNESFHGTSYFQPGSYGYMQHMWFAALSPEAVLFVNHPNAASERSFMRPGYWNGNAVMPAVKQEKNLLGVVHDIPEETQIKFTHVYIPAKKFDEVVEEGNWFFLRKDNGFLALWCSEKTVPHDEMIFGCEHRVYAEKSGYFCTGLSKDEAGDFENFKKIAKSYEPSFNKETSELFIQGKSFVKYVKGNDTTQYLD